MSQVILTEDALSEESRFSASESHIYTAERLLSSDFPTIEEVVEGMFVAGRSCVIGGAYGIGKTTLSIQLGVALAAGESVFGRRVGRAYRVGYFDLELGAAEFQRRFKLARGTIQDIAKCDRNFCYIDGSAECDLFKKLALQPDKDGSWLLANVIREKRLEIVIVDNLSLAVPGDLSDPVVCMALHQNLGRLRKQAPTLMLPFLPCHLVKPSREGGPPSLLNDPRAWLAGIRGSGKLLDHITQRFGFDQEQHESGSEYFVLNGISSHKLVSPLMLEQDFETRQFHVSTDPAMNLSVVLTRAQRRVWDALPPEFKYADVRKLAGGSGYRMFLRAKEHGLIVETELGVWRKIQDTKNMERMEQQTK